MQKSKNKKGETTTMGYAAIGITIYVVIMIICFILSVKEQRKRDEFYESTLSGKWVPLAGLKPYCSNRQPVYGVYVIRNRMNGKCYVGQSKDVINRVANQHFHGTVPKNEVFQRDYWTAPADVRDYMFEVQITPLTANSSLNYAERILIEKYDSYRSGYNRTRGNR